MAATPLGVKAAGIGAARPSQSAGGVLSSPARPAPQPNSDGIALHVVVRDNNVDQALKVLKKKMQREGIFREMKLRHHYEKPSDKRARERAEAIRRARKLARKRAQKEL